MGIVDHPFIHKEETGRRAPQQAICKAMEDVLKKILGPCIAMFLPRTRKARSPWAIIAR